MIRQKKSARSLTTLQTTRLMLVELRRLRVHEGVDLRHLKELQKAIQSDMMLKLAIAVDKATSIILDGHHRFNALSELGCRKIPVTHVDYGSAMIRVSSWGNGRPVTKEAVIQAGLSGNILPPRTSRHMIDINGKLQHISTIEHKVDYPLHRL